MRRLIIWTGFAALLVTLVATVAAAATPRWTVAAVDVAGSAGTDEAPSAPSCWAARECVFVGTYAARIHGSVSYTSSYAATRSGEIVSAVELPLPSDADTTVPDRSLIIADVSCPAAGSCVAVGRYRTRQGGFHAAIETLTGSGWAAAAAPLPNPNHNAALASVACNPTQCVATGSYDDVGGHHAVLLDRRGTGPWSVRDIIVSPGDQYPFSVYDAACPATGACYSLATDLSSDGRRQLLLHPSGSAWTGVYLPVPPGVDPGYLHVGGMSCPTEGNCAALMDSTDSDYGNARLWAVTMVDGDMSASPVSLPAPERNRVFARGTDCATARACVGLASYSVTDSTRFGLLVRRSGTSWTARRAPVPAAAAPGWTPVPLDVSCASATSCTAVGVVEESRSDLATRPLVETLSGGVWRAVQLRAPLPPDKTERAGLYGVACVGEGCLATGHFEGTYPPGVNNAMYAAAG